jgi:hypothetical protein
MRKLRDILEATPAACVCAPALLAVSRSTGKCPSMKRLSISRVGDTLPHACPGARPSASAAASPVVCSPMTTAQPSSSARRASGTTVGTWCEREQQQQHSVSCLRSCLLLGTSLFSGSQCGAIAVHER